MKEGEKEKDQKLKTKTKNPAPLSSFSHTPTLMGDMDGLLVDDIGFDGSLQWVTARCGDTYGPGYHYAVTSAVEGVAGYAKRPPLQHHLTTTGTLLARMSDAIQSLADHAASSSSSASGRPTSRSGAAWRDRAFPGHRRRHVLVLNVTGHAHTDSFKRGFEANLVMSETDHVPFTDLVRHVGARLAEARAAGLDFQHASDNSSLVLEVVLDISSCFVPSACIETAMELKRLSASFPGVHVILPCDLVIQPDAIGFNMGFHAKLLEGASVRDAAMYAGQHNHFSVRGIVLFTGGERLDVRPLFPWGSSKADRLVLPRKRKRPQEEPQEEDDDVEKNVEKKRLSPSTPITATAAEAVIPNTPTPNTTPNTLNTLNTTPNTLNTLNTTTNTTPNTPNTTPNTTLNNLYIDSDLTTLQLADIETMGFWMVSGADPRLDPQRSKALVGLRERFGTEVVIYALGPVPVGSTYAGSVLISSGTIGPSAPAPWDRGCLFSRSERQQISNLDGLSGQERKRQKRIEAAQGGAVQDDKTNKNGAVFQNVLGRSNGCTFCKHGLVSAQGLARIYPRIKAHLSKTYRS
jgi:hypothetical protein